jgi:membrane-bound lytic murein transglycosylase B
VQSDAATDAVAYGRRDDVMQFGADIAARHGLDAGWVRDALAQARMVPSVARFIMPPPSGIAKNWAAYRARFVEPTRIRAGAAFWRANEKWLARAEETFGVPPRSSSASSASRRSTASRWATSPGRCALHVGVRFSDRAQGPQRLLP